jgi:rhamnopyranosyl-N-acetylglucosaminyl-diphospho-decaprenol beta-1,3/1,4-galactofuranosyltransferase
MKHSVAAVIVTYNRQQCLESCLEAVQGQTRMPEAVIVVDNASTDGTSNMVRQRYPGVTLIELSTNTGGAGGFNCGLKAAYRAGHEWFWLMDDDGVPDTDCLNRLLRLDMSRLLVRSPLVIDKDDHDLLSFSLPSGDRSISTVKQAHEVAKGGIIEGAASPFNGLLLNRSAVAKIGFPIAEFFIWGDEVEYLLRVKRNGISIGTVVDAVLHHPTGRRKIRQASLLGVRFHVRYLNNAFYDHTIVRNHSYIKYKYYGALPAMGYMAKYVTFNAKENGLKAALRTIASCLEGIKWARGSTMPSAAPPSELP